MKAFIVTLAWDDDPTVVSNVVLFADGCHEAFKAAERLYGQTHTVKTCVEAPWLNKPEWLP